MDLLKRQGIRSLPLACHGETGVHLRNLIQIGTHRQRRRPSIKSRQGQAMTPLPSLDAAKAQARYLRADLATQGRDITHSAALELVAKSYGQRDWNTLHAAIGNEPRQPVHQGQIVPGHYLSQEFLAEVTDIHQIGDGQYEVTLAFDKPVDVVTFDSFSNFRSRVRKVIGTDGQSLDKTSDGAPHLILWG
jgi:hypothetical protein